MGLKQAEIVLFSLQGMLAHRMLGEEERTKTGTIEHPQNRGVAEVLSRKYVLVAVHNSNFRKPPTPTVLLESEGKIVGRENVLTGEFELEEGADANGTYLFPPVPFPELEGIAQNVVSASPSRAVHEYLMGLLELEEKPELATLLIGFELPENTNARAEI